MARYLRSSSYPVLAGLLLKVSHLLSTPTHTLMPWKTWHLLLERTTPVSAARHPKCPLEVTMSHPLLLDRAAEPFSFAMVAVLRLSTSVCDVAKRREPFFALFTQLCILLTSTSLVAYFEAISVIFLIVPFSYWFQGLFCIRLYILLHFLIPIFHIL